MTSKTFSCPRCHIVTREPDFKRVVVSSTGMYGSIAVCPQCHMNLDEED